MVLSLGLHALLEGLLGASFSSECNGHTLDSMMAAGLL